MVKYLKFFSVLGIIFLITILGGIVYSTVYISGVDDSVNATYGNFENVSADGYYSGQPLTGSIDSGVIYSARNLATCGCINVSDKGGLNVTVPDIIVRIANTNTTIKYCTISEVNLSVEDDTHNVYYIDSSCNWVNITFTAYFDMDLSPGNYARVFDVHTSGGDIESVKGASLMSLSERKSRRKVVNLDHLSVISGMAVSEGTFPIVAQSSGQFIYINSLVSASASNSSIAGIHHVHHTSGSWTHTNRSGLNLSVCDNSTNLITCGDNNYRRYILYSIGTSGAMHQLAPLTTDSTFTTLSGCLNLEATPLSYTLPTADSTIGSILASYCGKRDDSAWRNGWMDLRNGIAGYGASIDISSFLLDEDFASSGLMKTDGSGTYSIVTDSSTNWDTAYLWGNHSTYGYFDNITDFTGTLTNTYWCRYDSANTEIDCDVAPYTDFGSSIDDTEMTSEDFGEFTCTGNEDGCTLDSGTFDDEYIELEDNFVGDVTGPYGATVVGDDSHNHSYTTITPMTEANLYTILSDVTQFYESGDKVGDADTLDTHDTSYFQIDLTDEASLYTALSDVSLFLEDLVDDTTPQLGGNLDANAHNIEIDTSNKLCLDGATCSHYVYYNGTHTIIH